MYNSHRALRGFIHLPRWVFPYVTAPVLTTWFGFVFAGCRQPLHHSSWKLPAADRTASYLR